MWASLRTEHWLNRSYRSPQPAITVGPKVDLLLIPNIGTSSGIRTHTVTILNRLPSTDWATEAYVGGLTGHFPLCTGYPTAASGGTFTECVRLQSPKPLCTDGLVLIIGITPIPAALTTLLRPAPLCCLSTLYQDINGGRGGA